MCYPYETMKWKWTFHWFHQNEMPSNFIILFFSIVWWKMGDGWWWDLLGRFIQCVYICVYWKPKSQRLCLSHTGIHYSSHVSNRNVHISRAMCIGVLCKNIKKIEISFRVENYIGFQEDVSVAYFMSWYLFTLVLLMKVIIYNVFMILSAYQFHVKTDSILYFQIFAPLD